MAEKYDKQNLPKTRAVLIRQIAYSDGYGTRTGIEYDSHYRLGNEPDRFVEIEGVGGSVHVHMVDIQFLIDGLVEVQELDEKTHS